jgi:hypothetical protein
MLKAASMLCAMLLVSTGSLRAGEVIQVEKLSRAELLEALQKAPDDAVIENRGQTKTKAEWRSDWLATHKPPDAQALKNAAAAAKAIHEAHAKALKDQQDKAIAEENAKVDAEFEAIKAR